MRGPLNEDAQDAKYFRLSQHDWNSAVETSTMKMEHSTRRMSKIGQGKEWNSLEDKIEHRPKVLKKHWEHLAEAEKCIELRTETTRKART